MSAAAVNNLFVRLGFLRAPSTPSATPEFLAGEICTSDPDKRVSRAFMGDATPRLGPAQGIAPAATRPSSGAPPRWTREQYERFAERVREYLAKNDTLIPHHAAWHEVNGPGGTRGAGSGLAFLQMHHEMMVDLARFITASGRDLDLVPFTEWRPSQPVPRGLGEVDRYSNDPHIPTPSWVTLAGGSDTAPGFDYTRLADFKNPDELGRALASGPPNNLGYHGAGHASVGGVMWSARAPQDPLFWLWHNHLDNIVTTWTGTANGRAWLATAEGRAWRTASGHHHHAAAGDPVAKRTEELLRLRATDPAQYDAVMSRSSFTQTPVNAWPADALPINVESSQRFPHLGVTVQTLATGLTVPSGLTFAANGDVSFTERNGSRRVIRDGLVQREPLPGVAAQTGGDEPSSTLITSGRFPQWRGRVAKGMLGPIRGLQLLELDDGGKVRGESVLFRDVFGRIRDVVQGPDGYLYLTTSNRDGHGSVGTTDDQILRIVPSAVR